ncbi:hypothetical protein JK636_13130 [Clostridium sp. YIM B02515]|uniref:Glycosyl transferase family 28 C-terminal domain-containing protein n=1 Tax=Clostridium rhizosphaerae TaxID=2803861 RepID=A0ABS1TBK4_9CLOT|nr:glycosyltransferase [Clostridium rhizosphaerae]MBL4936700.1 hypothetical protein [Clostridium rhizosphaerae]
MSKKVLVIYEKMGMGHLRMARILEDVLKDDDVEVVKYAGSDMIGDSSINGVVKLWNFCIRKDYIRTVDLLLNFIVRIFVLPFIEVSNTTPFYKKLEEINPDIIICTADGFNKAVGSYAKEKGIPFYIFITEVSIFIDLVNPYATHICYFNETGDAIRSYDFSKTYHSYKLNKETTLLEKIQYILEYYRDYVFQGYRNSIFRNPNKELEENNDANYRAIGPLAEKKHFTDKDIKNIKKKYGFDNGLDSAILASGSIGGKFLLQMVQLIAKTYKKPLNLLVICGRDENIYNKVNSIKVKNPNINIMTFKYIENFDEVLAAADCIVGRPSAGIFIESLLNKTPEITFRRATSNDKGTLTMIEKYNIGKVVESNREIVKALEDILESKEQYQNNIEKLLNKYCRSYEEKGELLRAIILNNKYEYELIKDFDAEVGLNTPLSH